MQGPLQHREAMISVLVTQDALLVKVNNYVQLVSQDILGVDPFKPQCITKIEYRGLPVVKCTLTTSAKLKILFQESQISPPRFVLKDRDPD